MKISVKKEYVEAYRQVSWKDVKEAFIFFLKNPGYVAIAVMIFIFVVAKVLIEFDSIARDEL